MKILIATGSFPPDIGGPATYTQKLASELVKRGSDVKIITYADKETLKSQIPIIRISRKYPKGLRHLLFFLATLKTARDRDVIYAQNLFSVGIPCLIVSKILRKKFVVKVVGDYAWEQSLMRNWFSGGIDEFQKAKSLKIDFLKWLQKTLAFNAGAIITPSRYLEGIISGWGLSTEKINVVYNAPEEMPALNLSKEEAQEKIRIRGNIILSIGRLAPWKGFNTLIEIMPDLLKENPNFRLVIVGEGEEYKNFQFSIFNFQLESNVKLVGKVNHRDIPFYYRAADVFVLNSEYEGLSHVILEAMQFGTPVIASDKGGNPELIEDNFNGILIEYNNKTEIKNAVSRLWQDKELCQRFIQNSKEKLREFTWENLVEKTLNILKEV